MRSLIVHLFSNRCVCGACAIIGHTNQYEWLRMWRFRPGMHWISHAPPALITRRDGVWSALNDVPLDHMPPKNCFSHAETMVGFCVRVCVCACAFAWLNAWDEDGFMRCIDEQHPLNLDCTVLMAWGCNLTRAAYYQRGPHGG